MKLELSKEFLALLGPHESKRAAAEWKLMVQQVQLQIVLLKLDHLTHG